ncbi:hypothetical protein RFI_28061, partial [Reticulomyxa filosa]
KKKKPQKKKKKKKKKQLFQELQFAYDALKDSEKRKIYDRYDRPVNKHSNLLLARRRKEYTHSHVKQKRKIWEKYFIIFLFFFIFFFPPPSLDSFLFFLCLFIALSVLLKVNDKKQRNEYKIERNSMRPKKKKKQQQQNTDK